MTGTYRSLIDLKIGGSLASPELMEDIIQVTVEESLHAPSMFVIAVKNDYFPGGKAERAWKHQNIMKIGEEVQIGFVASTTESPSFNQEEQDSIFKGEISAIETHFTERSQAPIIIRGYDTSHRLHRGRWNRSFQNMTDTDVVKKIAQEAGIEIGKVESSGIPHEYLFQQNQTNMEFLRERAARLGFELFVSDGKLNFRKPSKDESLKLKWLKDIDNFRVRVSSAEQVKEVEVRAWDYKAKKAIVSKANQAKVMTETQNGEGSQYSAPFNGKPKDPTMRVIDRPVSCAKEAETIAQSLFNELGGQFVYADARAEGNPKLRPGRVVELEEMGKHDGKYYITETRHTYFERIYQTDFSVRGLRNGNLLNTLSPPQRLQPGQTCLIGIVTNNADPEGLHRVKVQFPSLTEEHESHWARVVSMGAGATRGFDWLPEVDDEVLVAFEHGDIHRPYVMGGVWNGQDAPPENVQNTVVDGKVRLRTLKTTSGHQIQLVEEDKDSSKKGIYIHTKDNRKIEINDSCQKIIVTTSKGQIIELDDSSGSLSIQAKSEIALDAKTIKLTASGSSIELGSSGVNIKSSATVNISGTATVNVKGGVISLN